MGAAQGNALGKESGCPVEEIFLKSIFIYLLAALPPGIKPVTPAVEAWSINFWTTREVSVEEIERLVS